VAAPGLTHCVSAKLELMRNYLSKVAARWLVTFGFSLIHGLGFALILRELGIGAVGTQAAIPLLSFNLGVELAQVSIAALSCEPASSEVHIATQMCRLT